MTLKRLVRRLNAAEGREDESGSRRSIRKFSLYCMI